MFIFLRDHRFRIDDRSEIEKQGDENTGQFFKVPEEKIYRRDEQCYTISHYELKHEKNRYPITPGQRGRFVVYKQEDHDDGNREDKMDHILKHRGEWENLPGEIDFLYDRCVREKDRRRHTHRISEPLPREKPRKKEKRVVFHLYPHHHLERYKKNKGKGHRLSDRPEITEDTALISDLQFFLEQYDKKVQVVLKSSAHFFYMKYTIFSAGKAPFPGRQKNGNC